VDDDNDDEEEESMIYISIAAPKTASALRHVVDTRVVDFSFCDCESQLMMSGVMAFAVMMDAICDGEMYLPWKQQR